MNARHFSPLPPIVIWLTGVSGAGKSTLAFGLEQQLRESGQRTMLLDGDVLRTGLCKDLGFSLDARTENIRRTAEVAKLGYTAGLIVLVSLISPLRQQRDMARQIIGDDAWFEVFVDTPLSVAEERDPKGLYAKARQGLIPEFTGISSPYEAPESPSLRLATIKTPAESIQELLEALTARQHA